MDFFNSAVDVLQTLVIALGAGLGIWGVINLLEGYGNDNPGANAHVPLSNIKELIDSNPLFRYYLTHTLCNFFVKPIDSDTSEEI